MKKILVLFIGLVLAANAFATADLNFSLQVGGEDEITLEPSDTVYLDVYVTDISAQGMAFSNTGEVTITITGNASFIQNDDFTYGNAFWPDFGTVNHQYVSSKVLRIQAGYVSGTQTTMLDMALDGIALDHIGVHCDGIGDVTISVATGGAWGNPQYWLGGTLYSDSDDTATGMTIHQTPEPMTIALLGLGGLFLRKRK